MRNENELMQNILNAYGCHKTMIDLMCTNWKKKLNAAINYKPANIQVILKFDSRKNSNEL